MSKRTKFIMSCYRFALHQVQTYEGLTCRELEAKPSAEGYYIAKGTIQKRLSYLVDAGVIRKGDKRKCEVTGRLAFTWWSI